MRVVLLALALFAAGCPSGLEEQQHVSRLRVLGVRADPPELVLVADAGLPSTKLTALAVDPTGAAISLRFALCTDLSGVPSPTLPCPGDAGIDLQDAGPLSARLDLSDPRILAFAAAAQLDGGSFDAGGLVQTLDNGVPLLVGFTARSVASIPGAPASTLSGFETLTLRSAAHGPAGVNPALIGLEIGDGGTVIHGQVARLQPVTAPKDDASKHYGFSFFTTAGSISSLRSTDTTATGEAAPTWVEWTAPAAPQSVTVWVVLRDGRGGTDWIEREVQVQ
jgi:hypothetical protein